MSVELYTFRDECGENPVYLGVVRVKNIKGETIKKTRYAENFISITKWLKRTERTLKMGVILDSLRAKKEKQGALC